MPGNANLEMIENLSPWFVRNDRATTPWGNVISMFLMLPGLRGFWPMSSYDGTLIYDLSGQARHLTRNAVTHQWLGLVPTGFFAAATTRYLYRADEAGLSITGTEGYMSAGYAGMTLGGWIKNSAAGSTETFISKWVTAANQRSFILSKNATENPQIAISTDGIVTTLHAATGTITAGEWTFVVGRFTPSTELATFTNGVKETTVAAIPASIFDSTAQFEIGRLGTAANYYTGYGSLFFLCAAALPDYMIQALYQHSRMLFI